MSEGRPPDSSGDPDNRPTVAILMWGDAVEDFLGPLGLTVGSFAATMTGGWLFGYVRALASAGVRTVVVCVSRQARRPWRTVHAATGAPVWALPLPRAYRALRRPLRDPYAMDLEGAFGPGSRLPRPVRQAVRDLAPFAALPARALCRVLVRERAQALVVQEYESARFDVAVAVGRSLGVPVFATFQGGTWHVSRLERWTRPRSLAAARGLIVASAQEAERVGRRYGLSPAKVAAVPNPLDLDRWRPVPRAQARRALGVPAEAEVVAWHGRVDVHRKGLDVLLDAWGRVTGARPGRPLRLRLVGTGPDAEAFGRAVAGRAGVDWRDEYVVDRDALRRHLSAADVYALPSRHEGSPVALAEALAVGLPSVAADAPGVRDVLGEPPAGVVVPTADPGALAEALGGLLDDGDRRARLAAAARRRAEVAFGLDAVGGQLRRVLLGGPGSGGPA